MNINFENIYCNLCCSTDFKDFLEVEEKKSGMILKIVKCQSCGLIFMNPRPVPSSIIQFYDNVYYPFRGFSNSLIDRIRKIRTKSIIKKYLKFIGKKGEILEIGCGNGEVLSLLKEEAGYKVSGVESTEIAVKGIKENLNIDVYYGTVEDANFLNEKFTAVILNHVLEHLYNPKATIIEINRILKQKGKLIFSTPNIKSFEFNIFRKFWHDLSVPTHLFFFDKSSLDKLITASGFKILKVINDVNPNTFYQSLINKFREQFILYKLIIIFKIPILSILLLANITLSLFGRQSRFIYICEKKMKY